jgi:hypothetical protein
MPTELPQDLLQAALVGYQRRLAEIDAHMADLRARVSGRAQQLAPRETESRPKKRRLSPEGRARIVAATKKRWAALRKAKALATRRK